jgi:hypothetical protein
VLVASRKLRHYF